MQSASSGLTLHRIESGLRQTVWRLGEPGTETHGLVLLEEGDGMDRDAGWHPGGSFLALAPLAGAVAGTEVQG